MLKVPAFLGVIEQGVEVTLVTAEVSYRLV
jgi:hypothetical protein